ncbi:hypothetical protein DYB26_002096 [Aphanomyces astaci]|uniref:Ferric reductase NAD binding domain-containing protein n=1 Tax=Aphanomyces astaci TaxID=112090 RepID=A0A3R6YJX2_APHAT|nr:hypothetical protein DYB26_002096 [Aphanomyces astaci]
MSTTESCAIEAPDVDGDLALRVFDSLDTIHSGVLSPALLAGGIRAAAATCRLSLHGDIDGVVGQVFFQRWHIDATQFADVVTSLPNLRTSVFDPPKTPRSDIDGNDNTTNGRNPSRLHAMWMSFQAYPSSIKVWWGLYAVLNVAVFLWKFDVYHQRKPAFNLSGYSVCIARGAAQTSRTPSVQIQVSGDWTRRLYDVVHPHLYVHIDGPIPAPAVEVRQYSVALLFGAGIGITPYISVLQQCLVDAKQHDLSSRRHSTPHMGQQVYVHWQTNKQTMFKTHQHILEQVGALPNLDVQLYLTGNFAKTAPDATDVLRVLQKMTSTCVDSNSVDPISGLANLPLPTKLGRPKYHGILTAVANAHRHAEIGVFFCGPAAIKTTIRDTLHQVTTECHKAGNNVTLKYHPEVF